jgi:hypothetical protein
MPVIISAGIVMRAKETSGIVTIEKGLSIPSGLLMVGQGKAALIKCRWLAWFLISGFMNARLAA